MCRSCPDGACSEPAPGSAPGHRCGDRVSCGGLPTRHHLLAEGHLRDAAPGVSWVGVGKSGVGSGVRCGEEWGGVYGGESEVGCGVRCGVGCKRARSGMWGVLK